MSIRKPLSMYSVRGDCLSLIVKTVRFAMILYELVTWDRPFGAEDGLVVAKAAALHHRRPELPHSIPQQLRQLIAQCWHQSPEQRPDFDTIVSTLAGIREQLPSSACCRLL